VLDRGFRVYKRVNSPIDWNSHKLN